MDFMSKNVIKSHIKPLAMTKQHYQSSRRTSSITSFCTWDKLRVGSKFDRTTSLGITEVCQLEAHQTQQSVATVGNRILEWIMDNNQHFMCCVWFFFSLSTEKRCFVLLVLLKYVKITSSKVVLKLYS